MTHDELLARLKEKGNYDLALLKYNLNGIRDIQNIYEALRAVVELHKPHITLVNRTTGATRQKCRCEADYPCPTIQAVTDNLK